MLSRLFSFFFFFFFWLVNKFYAFLNFRRRVNESRALESNLLIIICGDSLARNFLGENACWRWRAGKWRGCGLHCGYHTLTSFQRAWNFLWSTSPPVWTEKCNLGAKMQNAECKMLKMLRAANFLSWRPAKKNLMQNMALKATRRQMRRMAIGKLLPSTAGALSECGRISLISETWPKKDQGPKDQRNAQESQLLWA